MKKKLAIIGASHFQNPLIEKAKEMGCETYVFAWQAGDVGERTADHFYPVSIREKDHILKLCREIDIDGICSIGSDLANTTVSYVAETMGLFGNPVDVVKRSTDKYLMRKTFASFDDPSPRSMLVEEGMNWDLPDFLYPIIVKPVDRSGSRGITKVDAPEGIEAALEEAFSESFSKRAVVEEFVSGEEFSAEFVSWEGSHTFLALTKKFTTGSPHFIETGHLEPAQVNKGLCVKIEEVVSTALDHLGVRYGASHAEVMVDGDGRVWIVEIGSRMGGDCIDSDLVRLSTGVDFTRSVVDIALGRKPDLDPRGGSGYALIRFVFGQDDVDVLRQIEDESPNLIEFLSPIEEFSHEVCDSSTRFGYFILRDTSFDRLRPYLPSLR